MWRVGLRIQQVAQPAPSLLRIGDSCNTGQVACVQAAFGIELRKTTRPIIQESRELYGDVSPCDRRRGFLNRQLLEFEPVLTERTNVLRVQCRLLTPRGI